jgi:hypothetical protein
MCGGDGLLPDTKTRAEISHARNEPWARTRARRPDPSQEPRRAAAAFAGEDEHWRRERPFAVPMLSAYVREAAGLVGGAVWRPDAVVRRAEVGGG